MITIPRLLAQHVAKVFRRALSPGRNRPADHPIQVSTGPSGLLIRWTTPGCAVEYCEPTSLPPAELRVPCELFSTVASTKREPVTIVLADDGLVVARWQNGAIPQAAQWTIPDADRPIGNLARPVSFAENSPALRQALHAAFVTTDTSSIRYALGCIQLRGQEGTLTATDGRQILVQTGFQFGFEEELLVERSAVFGYAGLPDNQPVSIGRTADQVVVRVGPWTFYLTIRPDGRFPQVEHVIPDAGRATSSLELHPADREFLRANLPRLASELGAAVTLDLQGRVVIRTKSQVAPQPTELLLTNSRCSGEPVCLATDCRFLLRALEMGFDRLWIFGPDSPIYCRDESRAYVWALLHRNTVLPADARAMQIGSPPPSACRAGELRAPRHPKTCRLQPPPHEPSMPHSHHASAAPASDPGTIQSAPGMDDHRGPSAKELAYQLRSELRDALRRMNLLIRSLPRQKWEGRPLKNPLRPLAKRRTA